VTPSTVTTTLSVPTTVTVITTLAPGAPATVTVNKTVTTTAVQTVIITVATKPALEIKEIAIGLLEPLTGAHVVFGLEAKQAAELMFGIINNELGGIKSLRWC